MSIAQNLKRLRKAARFSQEVLADRAGVKQSAISRYERGAAKPDLITVLKLAAALGESSDALVAGLYAAYDAVAAQRQEARTEKQHARTEGEDPYGSDDQAISIGGGGGVTLSGDQRVRLEQMLARIGDIADIVANLRAVSDAVQERAAAFALAPPTEQRAIAGVIAPREPQPGTPRKHQRQAGHKTRRR